VSWLEETEEQFLEDPDDTDADPSYLILLELRKSKSDSDISEPMPRISIERSNTSQTSRSRSRSPIAQHFYYLGKDKQTKCTPPCNVRTASTCVSCRNDKNETNTSESE